jgi:transcriptional regulator with XRE-family HTH domain
VAVSWRPPALPARRSPSDHLPGYHQRCHLPRGGIGDVRLRRLSFSSAYLWQLRTGAKDNPTIRHIEALARFFEVSPAHFFDDEPTDPRSRNSACAPRPSAAPARQWHEPRGPEGRSNRAGHRNTERNGKAALTRERGSAAALWHARCNRHSYGRLLTIIRDYQSWHWGVGTPMS